MAESIDYREAYIKLAVNYITFIINCYHFNIGVDMLKESFEEDIKTNINDIIEAVEIAKLNNGPSGFEDNENQLNYFHEYLTNIKATTETNVPETIVNLRNENKLLTAELEAVQLELQQYKKCINHISEVIESGRIEKEP